MGQTQQGLCLDKFCALGLDLSQGYLCSGLVARAYRIGQYGNVFSPGQKAQSSRLDGAFHRPANQNEFIGPQLTEHSVGTRLLEWVYIALLKYDLVVLPKYIARQVRTTIRGKADSPGADGVAYLFRSVGGIKAAGAVFSTVVINAGSGNHADILQACPGHYPSDIGENPAVVPDARCTGGEEEFLLSVNID